jgi:hypothetical protein
MTLYEEAIRKPSASSEIKADAEADAKKLHACPSHALPITQQPPAGGEESATRAGQRWQEPRSSLPHQPPKQPDHVMADEFRTVHFQLIPVTAGY